MIKRTLYFVLVQISQRSDQYKSTDLLEQQIERTTEMRSDYKKKEQVKFRPEESRPQQSITLSVLPAHPYIHPPNGFPLLFNVETVTEYLPNVKVSFMKKL